MNGTVILEHRRKFVIHLDDGHWCLIKPLGRYDLMIGDVLSGNLNEEGSCEILNMDRNCKMNVEILSVTKYIPLIPKD